MTESPIIWRAGSEGQKKAARAFHENDILFFVGPAGTGKTQAAVALALSHSLPKGQKVVISRPMVEACEDEVGYLKGGLSEKFAPYFGPIVDVLSSLTTKSAHFTQNWFEIVPLAFMRGRNFDGVAILDEAQNANRAQLKLFLSRLRPGGKLIVTGDPDQTDVDDSGLMNVVHALKGLNGVATIRFSASETFRHPLVPAILTRLSK